MRHFSCYSLPLLLLRGASSPALQNRAKCSAFGSSSADKLRRFLLCSFFASDLPCNALSSIQLRPTTSCRVWGRQQIRLQGPEISKMMYYSV
jgi:hypothetical protein